MALWLRFLGGDGWQDAGLALKAKDSWRWYLEPRLLAVSVPDLQRYLFVSFIWAVWHFPLILATDYTEISFAIYLPMFVLGTMLTAVVYGQMRKASQTVWTSVLMHGVANTFLWAIIENELVTFNNKVIADAADSVLMILVWAALAWWMMNKRKRGLDSAQKEMRISPQS